MLCPGCGFDNPIPVRFCVRCHETLWFACPSCGNVQGHGGTCDHCGVDFVKFGAMIAMQQQVKAEQVREKQRRRIDIWKQVLLLPITGGWSLIRYLFSSARRE